MKLVLIGVLAGALGLVGCGDDATSGGGNGGSGGTAGTGGTGGSEPLEACSEGPLAETGQTGTGALACVATLPFDLSLRFNATPREPLQAGANTFDLQIEVAIDADTVDTVIDLAPGADVTGVEGTIDATMGDSAPTPVVVVDEGVPCMLTFEASTPAVIVTTMSEGTWNLDDGGTLELTLGAITQAVTALTIPVVLTTEGDDPACVFVGELPKVQFTLPQ